MIKILYSPYRLIKKVKLNSVDQLEFQKGALIKVINENAWGVADICPKTELGDSEIDIEIKENGRLRERALELAHEDLVARKNKKSLLFDKFLRNNYLITDFKNIDLNQDKYLNQTLKIKCDRDIQSLSRFLNNIKIDLHLRLDFNSCLSDDLFDSFLNLLSRETLKKIEYIEDPTLINLNWIRWNKKISLAFDFQNHDYDKNFAKFRIIKPSREKLPNNIENAILTSAMEHPVGLAHGLRLAQQATPATFGFLTLNLYEDVGFNKYFLQKENLLNFSEQALEDSGIGMTAELNKLKWIEL